MINRFSRQSNSAAQPRRKPERIRKSRLVIQEQFGEQNRDAARIIMQDVARYGGEQSLMVRWARRMLDGDRSETLPLWSLVA